MCMCMLTWIVYKVVLVLSKDSFPKSETTCGDEMLNTSCRSSCSACSRNLPKMRAILSFSLLLASRPPCQGPYSNSDSAVARGFLLADTRMDESELPAYLTRNRHLQTLFLLTTSSSHSSSISFISLPFLDIDSPKSPIF